MADEKHEPEPKQTTPKGHEIPTPKHREVFEALDKLAKASDNQANPAPEGTPPKLKGAARKRPL